VVKILRVLYGLPQTSPILYVTVVVAYPGVEDVLHRVAPEEQVADNPHAFPIHSVSPQPPQIGYRVDYLLLPSHQALEGAE
jgi:hypothetical protein